MSLTEQQIAFIKGILYLELAKGPDMNRSELCLNTIRTLEEMDGAE